MRTDQAIMRDSRFRESLLDSLPELKKISNLSGLSDLRVRFFQTGRIYAECAARSDSRLYDNFREYLRKEVSSSVKGEGQEQTEDDGPHYKCLRIDCSDSPQSTISLVLYEPAVKAFDEDNNPVSGI